MAIAELFHHERLPNGLGLPLMLLYAPFGFVLVIFRFFFTLQLLLLSKILPKNFIGRRILLRVACGILGTVVSQEGIENYHNGKSKVIVSNHVTLMDNIAMETLIPSIMVSRHCDSPSFIQWILGYENFNADQGKEVMLQTVNKSLAESTSDMPLLVYPEDGTTNGQKGMLKFSSWPFELKSEFYVPVLVSVRRPPVTNVAPNVIGSTFWSDYFWSIFVPYTCYQIRFLEAMKKSPDVSSEEFSKQVQQYMSASSRLQATNHTSQDKKEYVKRYFIQEAQIQQQVATAPRRTPQPDTRLTNMTRQVKEVLPHVPADVIRRDLVRTKCIDTTITNILEGRITFTPETAPGPSSPSTATQSPPTKTNKNTPVATPQKSPLAASSFSTLPQERSQSFEERKRLMFENARRRYIEKHGL